jgi:hypothetical protein
MDDDELRHIKGRLYDEKYKEYKFVKGELDIGELCSALNMSEEEFVSRLLYMVDVDVQMLRYISGQFCLLMREKEAIETTLDKHYKSSTLKQREKVRNGLPIATKYSVYDYSFYKAGNWSDTEIMEYLGCSRTTLWRLKKRAEALGLVKKN